MITTTRWIIALSRLPETELVQDWVRTALYRLFANDDVKSIIERSQSELLVRVASCHQLATLSEEDRTRLVSHLTEYLSGLVCTLEHPPEPAELDAFLVRHGLDHYGPDVNRELYEGTMPGVGMWQRGLDRYTEEPVDPVLLRLALARRLGIET